MRTLLFSLAMSISVFAAGLNEAIPDDCRQVVCVVAPNWDASRGTLRRFERDRATAAWREAGPACEVLLGERGLAWGLGRHRLPARAARFKKEGDRRAPAGVFDLTRLFGRRSASEWGKLAMPYLRLTADMEAVDDPASRDYNRIVRRGKIRTPDWRSSERMAEIEEYELGIVVVHNPQRQPGAGSCIFLHQWREERRGTAGCTVLRPPDLHHLACWLDAAKHPILVQLPRSETPPAFR